MAVEDEVKLIGGWASPYVARARIAFNLKGIEYEFLQEEFGHKSELLLKSNPIYKKIPVLIHGDKPICESLIIVQYIDEVWAASDPSILPADPYDRAVARFWASYIDDKLPLRVLIWSTDEESRAEAKEQTFAVLMNFEDAFLKCSKGKSFFGGDTIGLVDIALGSYLGWLKAIEMMTGINILDETKTPHLVEWAELFCSAGVVKEILPEPEKLIEFSKVIRAARSAAETPPSK